MHFQKALDSRQAAALVGGDVAEVGQSEAVPEVEERHDAALPARLCRPGARLPPPRPAPSSGSLGPVPTF